VARYTQQVVDLSRWNRSFPPTSLKATGPKGSRTVLRPDYLAVRPTSRTGRVEWAVVESKGTRASLANMEICRATWSKQARNVALALNEVPIRIQRHLVVATRVNTNAANASTRRIQVRAWNSRDDAANELPPYAAIEIMAAQLFGIFRNLGLQENARAIAASIFELRNRQAKRREAIQDFGSLFDVADEELHRGRPVGTEGIHERDIVFRLETVNGPVDVTLSAAIIDVARRVRSLESPDQAADLIKEIDVRLDEREQIERSHYRSG
jgi:hypothetical protein